MQRTFEAVIDRQGTVLLQKPIRLPTTHRVLVTILDGPVVTQASEKKLRPFGLCAGEFTVPDDFDDPLPEDIVDLFTS